MIAASAPFGPEGNEWLRAYFAETAQTALTNDRIFVKHPSGQWIEASFFVYGVPCYPTGASYSGVNLPPPARTHHRVMKSVGIWWCLGCNANGTGAPPLHPQPWKEESA